MKKQATKPQTERKTIELVPSDDPRLAEVAGGRNYGWEYGGWICQSGCVAPPLPEMP